MCSWMSRRATSKTVVSRAHEYQLHPAVQQLGQLPLRFVRQGTDGQLDTFPETRQPPGVDLVRLGEDAASPNTV